MIKITLILLIFNHCLVFSQLSTDNRYFVKKSTLTSIGSSNKNFSNKNLKVLQSIGQSGLIGYRKTESANVQQGFLNSTIYLKVNNSNNSFVKESLNFVISPNPFIDHININFSKKTKFDVYIRIFDVNGKLFFSKKYKPTDKIFLPLIRYSIGNYLIKIDSGKNSSTQKILKIE